MRIARDCLVDKGLNANYNKSHNITSFLCSYSTAYFAAFCMVLAPIVALDSTRDTVAAQQASDSCCKSVHPSNSPALNKT